MKEQQKLADEEETGTVEVGLNETEALANLQRMAELGR